jgi:hypothetical protein
MRSFALRETLGGFTATVASVSRTVFSSGSAMSLPFARRRVVVRVVVRLVCFAIHASHPNVAGDRRNRQRKNRHAIAPMPRM